MNLCSLNPIVQGSTIYENQYRQNSWHWCQYIKDNMWYKLWRTIGEQMPLLQSSLNQVLPNKNTDPCYWDLLLFQSKFYVKSCYGLFVAVLLKCISYNTLWPTLHMIPYMPIYICIFKSLRFYGVKVSKPWKYSSSEIGQIPDI